jgi:lactoylglutathione lyase
MSARHVLTILAVDDLAALTRFYDDAFAWPVAVAVPVYREYQVPGGQRLGLYQRQHFAHNVGGEVPAATPPGALSTTEVYFHVDDVDAALARLLAAGARLLSTPAPRPWGDLAAYVADPVGTVLVVARPLPAS